MTALTVTHLSKRYRNGTLANDDLSLQVAEGEVYGLLGPNGAGKTTLVKQVLGLLKPTSGSITVGAVDVVADPGHARRSIGYLPQGQFHMAGARVEETIFAIARLRGLSRAEARRRTEELIARFDLEGFRKTCLRDASGGVQRLTGVATALAGGQRMLVLDEPTNDVDPVRRQLLWNMISELGKAGTTILLVTHNLAEAERVIDRFAIIDKGRIVREGTPAALRSVVTDRLRLELTTSGPVEPHPALDADGTTQGAYMFDHAALGAVSAWLVILRDRGLVDDFRIGPPTLDDIYAASLAAHANEARRAVA